MTDRYPSTSTNQILDFVKAGKTSQVHDLLRFDHEIQGLIQSFNLCIEKMFEENGPVSLAEFTTAEGIARFKEKYKNWKNQQIMGLRMLSCQFLSFTLSEDRKFGQVFTFEKWVFVYPGQKEVATEGSVDGYTIHLVDGQWKVDSVTFYAPNLNPG